MEFRQKDVRTRRFRGTLGLSCWIQSYNFTDRVRPKKDTQVRFLKNRVTLITSAL